MTGTVLGAGNDDLEPGRAYLRARADGEPLPDEVPDLYPYAVGLGLVAPTIEEYGTAEQKQRWLPPIAPGEEIWCQLFSEPDAGSDLAGLRTRAERDGDTFVLNGQKVWTSGAQYCQYGLGIFRSDPDAPKHKGISCLVVDLDTPGI